MPALVAAMVTRIDGARSPGARRVCRSTAIGISFIGPPTAPKAAAAAKPPTIASSGSSEARPSIPMPMPEITVPASIWNCGRAGSARPPNTRVAARLVQP